MKTKIGIVFFMLAVITFSWWVHHRYERLASQPPGDWRLARVDGRVELQVVDENRRWKTALIVPDERWDSK